LGIGAVAAAACSSFDNGTPAAAPARDAGLDRSDPAPNLADAAPAEPTDGAAGEAAALDPDACVPLDCTGTIVCDEFNRATAEGPSWGRTPGSSTQPLTGDAGLVMEAAHCSNALVAFMPALGGTAAEQLLQHTTPEPLDALTAEMDVWIDSPATYYDQHNNVVFAVGDKDQIAAAGRLAGLRYDHDGLSLYVRDENIEVKRPVAIAMQQWTHLKWHVDFSSDPDAGHVSLVVNGQPAVNEPTATVSINKTPLASYVIQLGIRNSNTAPAMTIKFDNVKLTRGPLQ